MFLLKLPFRVLFWIVRRILRALGRKSLIWFVALITFMSLDLLYPALGGSLTTIGLVVGPGLVMGMLYVVMRRWDGTAGTYVRLGIYMCVCGLYGLLRAWSAAAGSDLPDFVGTMSRWAFGPLINLGLAVTAALFGHGNTVPMPVWGEKPFLVHLGDLDPWLTGISLICLIWAVHIVRFTVKRYGGGDPARTEAERALAGNRLTAPERANIALTGWPRTLFRQIRNALLTPKIAEDEMVIGMNRSPVRSPWRWPLILIGYLMIAARMRPEGSVFDPRALLIARFGNGALCIGGAGAGKTMLQYANLALSDSPKLLVETQGNVADKDAPLIASQGRMLHILSPDLLDDSASLNLLEALDPHDPQFANEVSRIATLAIPQKGDHIDLRRCTFELVACALANIVILAEDQKAEPTLAHLYDCLTDQDLHEYLLSWAEAGHPAFRGWAKTCAARLEDPEFASSLAAIWSPELSFLGDPAKSDLICGGTPNRFSPADLLHDNRQDVAIQIARPDIKASGALLRLMMHAVVAPRIALSASEAAATRARGLTVYIDELAALDGAELLDDIVVFHRQKDVRFIYNAQSIQQIETLHGPGTFEKWADSANVRIYAKLGGDHALCRHVSEQLGQTLEYKDVKIAPAGGGIVSHTLETREKPLLRPEEMAKLPNLSAVVLARARSGRMVKIVVPLPAHFKHPALKAHLQRARGKFGVPGLNRRQITGRRPRLLEDRRPV